MYGSGGGGGTMYVCMSVRPTALYHCTVAACNVLHFKVCVMNASTMCTELVTESVQARRSINTQTRSKQWGQKVDDKKIEQSVYMYAFTYCRTMRSAPRDG